MSILVTLSNGQPRTTSIVVADTFGKNHKDVLTAIRDLECSQDFAERNFTLCNYVDANNRERPAYTITRDGFTFLAMGFTGSEAAKFKEAFIAAFNALERQQQQPPTITAENVVESLQAMIVVAQQQRQQAQRIERVEQKLLTYDGDTGYRTVLGYCREHGYDLPIKVAQTYGRQASALCRERDIRIGTVPDERYGTIQSYPVRVLRELIGQ